MIGETKKALIYVGMYFSEGPNFLIVWGQNFSSGGQNFASLGSNFSLFGEQVETYFVK